MVSNAGLSQVQKNVWRFDVDSLGFSHELLVKLKNFADFDNFGLDTFQDLSRFRQSLYIFHLDSRSRIVRIVSVTRRSMPSRFQSDEKDPTDGRAL